jgi:glutathione S-transferase
MLVLYDNAFSPFTRKVRMVLDYKGIPFESVDGLALAELPRLRELSRRAEVPVLVDGDLVIPESADIVAYLEDLKPIPTIFPVGAANRARARSWQRTADRVIDAILHDISLWIWPTHRRGDEPPARLLELGHADLHQLLTELERSLADGPFICGDLSIADFAVQPHMPALRFVGFSLDPARYSRVLAWQRRMKQLGPVRRDLENARRAVAEKFGSGASPYEGQKVVWRGDRIEWLLSKGYDEWWLSERRSGRAVVPSPLAGA